ncbi:efflux RND transporter periplasmic adaptor subunit [Pontibacter sp. G13]|uniref:efflux RND transporter periplasmic adaptor subunit n=1 Tax=Pontibacter sp. G13 TaxID=3074898 RepID=UPI00288C55CA|nr:efflux RND transporter periplasmic adaptor subunit [Pontibacter sp. G13]WNJ18693.1 efflux RND transporter periplasmic adaptor subunit [Pontibacter sp. G13]
MDRVSSMDRVVEKKKWTPKKIALYFGLPLLAVALLVLLVRESSAGKRLKVERERLTIATVESGVFQEFIPIPGEVEAVKTVFIDAFEGGQVKELYLEGGEKVSQGDLILKLTNPSLELNYMNLQTNLLEQADQLRNTKITMENTGLNLKEQLIQVEYQVIDQGQVYQRNLELFQDSVISEADFLTVKNNYEYQLRRKELLLERIKKDSILTSQQVTQVDKSLALVSRNLTAIQRSMDNLTIKAPVDGRLSEVTVEIGQTVRQGDNLAQIDLLRGYKVRGTIDEHYISRIHPGLTGYFTFSGEQYQLQISKVYPNVSSNGTFAVDMLFVDSPPAGLKRRQNLQIRLALSDETTALKIPRGSFFQTSGGNYIYVLSEDGTSAYKRDISIGRQSDREYQVVSGLERGEQVITSSYESFNNADVLILQD